LNYRSDIDGLRTIAVFLVILNHVGFTFITGGFVGVDVFFVISGFLITSIIYPKLKDKTFNFAWFLSRRVKRLMPVLFFIVFCTIILFSFVMLPSDLVKFYRSVIWVILYAGNFFFWREYGGYFDGGSQEAPLLHTWSLAVEEQYYFIWPIMLAIMVRYIGAKLTIWLTIAMCIIATIFSQWGTEVTIGAAYYLLPTRFFELLVGSCLALSWQYLAKPSAIFQHLLSIIGLLMIVLSSLILTEHHSFPGYNALYPVIGTALIIYARSGVINKFLTTKLMTYTGNISYSLYLWHWPLIALVSYTSTELTLTIQLAIILITYLLSMLSYRYIEEPFRHMKLPSFKQVALKLYCLPAALLIFTVSVGVYNNGFVDRFSPEIVHQETAVNSFASESRQQCHSALRNSNVLPDPQCTFGDSQATESPKLFILGDSHANHIVPFLEALAIDAQLTGQDYTLDRCLPLFDLGWGSNLYKANKCKDRNTLASEHIKNNSFDYVVLAASWPEIATRRIFTDQRIESNDEKRKLLTEQFDYTLGLIVNSGATPIIIEDIPTLGGLSPKCTIKKSIYNDSLNCQTNKNSNHLISNLVQNIRSKYPQLIVLRPQDIICTGKICKMDVDNTPIYRDEDHLNEVGAKLLGEKYILSIGNPLKKIQKAKQLNPVALESVPYSMVIK